MCKNRTSTGHSVYPDVFPPASGYPFYSESAILKEGIIQNRFGGEIQWSELTGKSVALLFADPDSLKTKSFIPSLLSYYRTINECGVGQKVEIVYVPPKHLLEDPDKLAAFIEHMPWLHLVGEAHVMERAADHFRVLIDRSHPVKYGYPSLTMAPGLVVVDRNGGLLRKLDVDTDGADALSKWDHFRNTI